jgi:CDP-diacylglycerol--serine O-phosphatidyltransferase
MDALDGRVARLTQTQTAFGAELDSLSDMVSFGVAPALVLYYWSLNLLGKFGWLSIFIYAVAVALRLARFNVQLSTSDKHYFKGLPCPAAAAVIAGLVWNGTEYNIDGHHISILIAIIAVILGLLMVSNLRFNSFKDIDLKGKVPFIVILILVAIFVLVSIEPATVLLVTFSIYAISGPLIWLWKWRKVRAFKKR